MTQQSIYSSANKRYPKRLFVKTGKRFDEVECRIVEPYTAPTPQDNSKEMKIINAPSHFQQYTVSSYKCNLSLLFMDKASFAKYLKYSSSMHKFYDEKGSIYLGVRNSIKVAHKEATTKYLVEIELLLIKKDVYDDKDRDQFQDIEGTLYQSDIEDMANLGLIAIISVDGIPVMYFRPTDALTRAEFIAFLNRTRKFIERIIRE